MTPPSPDLEKAQRALALARAKADADWWSPSAKKRVEECRRAVARAQQELEAQGQESLPLEIEEVAHAPEAFR